MDIKKNVPEIRFEEFKESDAWEQRELGEVADIVGGGTPSTSVKEFWDGGIDWYFPVEIGNKVFVNSSQKKITELGFQKSSAQMLPAGTVLFTSRAGIGSTAILEKEACTNQGFQSIVPKDNLDTYFIYSRTHELKRYGEITGAGSTFVEVSGKQMAKMPILVPDIEEQREIGNFFQKLDQTIAFQQRKLEKTQMVKKSLLEKMFPKNGESFPEIRFDGFTDAWEQRELSKIATMNARIGWQNLRTSEFLDEGNYMLITGTDFEDGKINYSTCHFVEKERYEQDKNIQIQNGSILITKDGTLGKVAYVEGLSTPATLNAGVFNVKIKNPLDTDDKYLFQYLKAPFLMNYVNKRATGGTIKHLNQNILVDFPVLMPKKEEQEKIGDFFHDLDQTIAFQQRELEKLKNMKKALLEKMFV